MALRQFGYKGHARIFEPLLDGTGDLGRKIQRGSAVNGLARVASSQNRQRPKPLARKDQDGVDVLPLCERRETVDGDGAKVAGNDRRTMGHRFADRPNLKSIAQCSQRGPMAIFPGVSDSNQADPKLHGQDIMTRVCAAPQPAKPRRKAGGQDGKKAATESPVKTS